MCTRLCDQVFGPKQSASPTPVPSPPTREHPTLTAKPTGRTTPQPGIASPSPPSRSTERTDVRSAKQETTVSKPPPATATVADREEVSAMCTRLCDQVFGPKQSASPAPVPLPPIPAGISGAGNGDFALHAWAMPSDREYLPERVDICTAELEATIAKPPPVTATVAETRAYCEELEAQTRIVEAEVRLLKLAGTPTSPRARPKLRGVADHEEVLATCTRLCDQVFGPKQSASPTREHPTPTAKPTVRTAPQPCIASRTDVRSAKLETTVSKPPPATATVADREEVSAMCIRLCDQVFGPKQSASPAPVPSPPTPAGISGAGNGDLALHARATTRPWASDLSDTREDPDASSKGPKPFEDPSEASHGPATSSPDPAFGCSTRPPNTVMFAETRAHFA